LQLAHAGRDEWLRVAHTLISLGRLADRNLISEQERSDLSEAYTFLRTLEHRLQMEHGLQTHTVPDGEPQRSLLARRMGFPLATAMVDFECALKSHVTDVRRAYDRVFADEVAGANVDGEVTRKRNGERAQPLIRITVERLARQVGKRLDMNLEQ